MSNSSLVCYKKISPNKTSPRNHVIDTITIHCMAGNLSVETCGNVFAPSSREASSNYGIGSDGRIALYVDEADRSWCSSSGSNDHRAVTIEVANDGGAETGWHVSDKACAALIDLCTDICKRNGIAELKWNGDKSLIGQVDKQNMTVHRWFANKACPGDWLYSRLGDLAAKVTAQLGGKTEESGVLYRVQTGAFSKKSNADAMLAKVKAAGFDTYMVQVNGLYKIQVGAYSKKSNAEAMLAKIKAKGFDAFITTKSGQAVSASTEVKKTIQVGSTVRLNKGAKTYSGGSLASFVYERNHQVKEISGDRAVITYGGTVVAAVKVSDLTLV